MLLLGWHLISLRCSSSQQQRREAPGAAEKNTKFCATLGCMLRRIWRNLFENQLEVFQNTYTLFSTILVILVNQHLDLRKVLHVQVLFD